MNNSKGFTIIELMIVAFIIVTLAGISLNVLKRSECTSNGGQMVNDPNSFSTVVDEWGNRTTTFAQVCKYPDSIRTTAEVAQKRHEQEQELEQLRALVESMKAEGQKDRESSSEYGYGFD